MPRKLKALRLQYRLKISKERKNELPQAYQCGSPAWYGHIAKHEANFKPVRHAKAEKDDSHHYVAD